MAPGISTWLLLNQSNGDVIVKSFVKIVAFAMIIIAVQVQAASTPAQIIHADLWNHGAIMGIK